MSEATYLHVLVRVCMYLPTDRCMSTNEVGSSEAGPSGAVPSPLPWHVRPDGSDDEFEDVRHVESDDYDADIIPMSS